MIRYVYFNARPSIQHLSALNLRTIWRLRDRFGVPVGLSDHSRDPILGPIGAVALGAKILEKHYTTDNDLPGPDHGFAVLPHELSDLVKSARKMEKALGRSDKVVIESEKELHRFARRSIYASKNIKSGEIFTEENTVILRSGEARRGLEPSRLGDLLGKKSSIDINENDPIIESCIRE